MGIASLLSGSPQTPPSCPPPLPPAGQGFPPLPSAHRDPREGQVLCPNLQNHHSLRAHPVTPGSRPCPTPTSPRTPASVRLGSAPLHCGRSPGFAQAASPALPASLQAPPAEAPPPHLPPRSCPGAGPQAPGATCRPTRRLAGHRRRGLGRGAGLDAGARGSPVRPRVRAGAPPPPPAHTHSHTLTHTHARTLTHTHTHTRTHTHARTLAVPEGTLPSCGSGRHRVKPVHPPTLSPAGRSAAEGDGDHAAWVRAGPGDPRNPCSAPKSPAVVWVWYLEPWACRPDGPPAPPKCSRKGLQEPSPEK